MTDPIGNETTTPLEDRTIEGAVFKAGDRIIHDYWGVGTIVGVWAVARDPDEETEYQVRIPGFDYLFTLGETRMILAEKPHTHEGDDLVNGGVARRTNCRCSSNPIG